MHRDCILFIVYNCTISVLCICVVLGRTGSAGRVSCPECGRRYSNLSNLRQHVRLIHRSQPVDCPLCSRSFKTQLYLRRHTLSQHTKVASVHQTDIKNIVPVSIGVSGQKKIKREVSVNRSELDPQTPGDNSYNEILNGFENIHPDESNESIKEGQLIVDESMLLSDDS